MKKLFLIYVSFWASSLFSIEPITLVEEKGENPLGFYLELLEDKERYLTIDDVQKPEMESLWVRSKTEVPSFGYTNLVYWVRFKIDSKTNTEKYLEIGYSHLDTVDFFIQNGKDRIHEKAGDFLPFANRQVDYRNFIFMIKPFETPSATYYFRIETESSLQIPTVIWSPKEFAEKKNLEMFVIGLYYGLMIAMALYNLFIWLSIREKSHLYYVCYIFMTGFLIFTYQGFSYQYLWFGSSTLYNQLFPSIFFITLFFTLAFTSNYLQIETHLPSFHKFYRALNILLVIGFFISLVSGYRLAFKIVNSLTLISCVWMLTVGIIMVLRKYRPAKFFIISWSLLLFGALILLIKNNGLLPRNVFTENSMQIGSALEVILLSFGLADRINDLKRQNEITQKKAFEAEQKSSKIKDEFLANLSHEIKTPLSVVYAYSEMMLTGNYNPDKVQKYSKEIHASAQKLNDYVSDLILITDIESNLQLQKSKVNLSEMLYRVVEQYRPIINEKEIQVDLQLAEILDFESDPILLEKAISAFLKNATVYNKLGGRISITTSRYEHELNQTELLSSGTKQLTSKLNQHIQIEFTDTGIGIPKEFHEKIFEKFFRIDSALTYEVSGVGLGLCIAKKIIELHNGTIEVTSELGAGSSFLIFLPTRELI